MEKRGRDALRGGLLGRAVCFSVLEYSSVSFLLKNFGRANNLYEQLCLIDF